MADRSSIEWTDATWNPIRARRTVEALLPASRRDFDPERYGIRLTPSQRRSP
jgi:hypothetical protein